MCEVGRVFPRYVQGTCLTGKSSLGCPRVARTLHLYNYLLRFHLITISQILLYLAYLLANTQFAFCLLYTIDIYFLGIPTTIILLSILPLGIFLVIILTYLILYYLLDAIYIYTQHFYIYAYLASNIFLLDISYSSPLVLLYISHQLSIYIIYTNI